MKAERKKKKVHYKRADIPQCPRTLQQLLETSLAENSPLYFASNRHQLLNEESQDFILINHHANFQGMFFGQLIFVEHGKSQSLITLNEETQEYEIQPVALESFSEQEGAVDSKRIRKQFIDSILYFGVFENHVVILQSIALRSSHLESHLIWLLGTAQALPDQSYVVLRDTVSNEARQKLNQNPAKSVKIGTPIEGKYDDSNHGIGNGLEAKSARFNLTGKGAEVLKALFGNNKIEGLKLEDGLDAANLKMYVVMTYDRSTSESGQKVIDSVATACRHFPDDDYQIDLKGGGKIKGGELRISGELTVEVLNGSVNESILRTQMYTWLMSNLQPNG